MRAVSPAEYQAQTTFYFDDRGELVVPQVRLPEVYPEVIRLEGESFVAEIENTKRESNRNDTAEHSGLGWQTHWQFEEGARLKSVTGFDRFNLLGYFYEGDGWGVRPDAHQTSTYVLRPDDQIILQGEDYSSKDILILDVAEGLPGQTAGFYQDRWYVPRAIISGSGELITWGDLGARDQFDADIVIANSLIESRADLRVLSRRLGQFSLKGVLSTNNAFLAYVDELHENSGRNFLPVQDPEFRYGEFTS